jgi:hypothetical protein
MRRPWMCLCAIHAIDALMERAMRCDCGSYDAPLCVECTCLFELVSAAVMWAEAQEATP